MALSLKRQKCPIGYIAKRLRVTPDAVSTRLRRLEKERKEKLLKSLAFWTPERNRRLIELWNAGNHSTRAIAYALGGGWRYPGQKAEAAPTNSAICGKINRLRKAGYGLRITAGRS